MNLDIWNYLGQKFHMYLLDIQYSPSQTGRFDMARTTATIFVLHQAEFVDRFNLETQNPRRDTSIPSVSAGLPPVRLLSWSRGGLVNGGSQH